MEGGGMISLESIDRATWDQYWPTAFHTPLLQAWEYGEAKRLAQKCRPHRFLVLDAQAGPLGLLQVLVYSLPIVGGIARINRGPVFLSEHWRASASAEQVGHVAAAVKRTARVLGWMWVRMAPGFFHNEKLFAPFAEFGFRKRDVSPCSSAEIGINRSPQEIRAGFHSKWRNLLKKSEKSGLELEVPPLAEGLRFLVPRYEDMQRNKQFKGIPAPLLRSMAEQDGPTWNTRILFAQHHGERHGAVMIVGHGDTCTYLVGWNSPTGRCLEANYFLLWNAMLHFREMGYRYFDVGGLGADTTQGVEHFKKRLQGDEYSLIGEYACFVPRLPWPRRMALRPHFFNGHSDQSRDGESLFLERAQSAAPDHQRGIYPGTQP